MNIKDTSSVLASMTAHEAVIAATRVIARCIQISGYTETPGSITRTFLSSPTRAVHDLIRGWMEAAGMKTCVDAAGNLRGLFPASCRSAPGILLGSHLDTVPNAGAFDGVLGVMLALAVVESLSGPLPFSVEIIGFSEEEGVRFGRPFFGSRAVTGSLDPAMLLLRDANGISMSEAIRGFGLDPAHLSGAALEPGVRMYLEIHIEQGPVLESCVRAFQAPSPALSAPVQEGASILGVVNAIAGQTRLSVDFHGEANHAGTTPMHLRHDALAAAAQWVVRVETLARHTAGLVATVGSLEAKPGSANVIAGAVRATLDVRHAMDTLRQQAVEELLALAEAAAQARGVRCSHTVLAEQPAVPMNAALARLLEQAVVQAGHRSHVMTSGAGHDAMILAAHLPSVMLFVPSPRGISHHPDESVLTADVAAALQTTLEFLRLLSREEEFTHA